jgi:hypothetical protein
MVKPILLLFNGSRNEFHVGEICPQIILRVIRKPFILFNLEHPVEGKRYKKVSLVFGWKKKEMNRI